MPGKYALLISALIIAFECPADGDISFKRDIAPILVHKCLTCHGPEKSKGGYQLQTFQGLMRAGDSDTAPIVPGRPEESGIFKLITAEDPDDRMPQKAEPLPAGQIALIQRWIKEGAKFDGTDPEAPLAGLLAVSHPDPPQFYPYPLPIRALAFTADGSELLVGGYHEISIWRVNDGSLVRRIKNFAQQIYCIAFHDDLIAVASGTPGRIGQVNLISAGDSHAGKVLATAPDSLLAVTLNSDGDRLAVAGTDNTIRIYEAPSGRQLLTIEQHADWVMGLAFSPDGQWLGSASRDKTARIFSVQSGELESTYVGHNDAVLAIAFGPDTNRVCSAGRDKSIHLWDLKEAKKVTEIKGFDDEIHRIIVRSNWLFSCSADKSVRQHSLGDKPESVRTFSGSSDVVYSIDCHLASGLLAAGSYDGHVRIWDVTSGEFKRTFIASPMRAAATEVP